MDLNELIRVYGVCGVDGADWVDVINGVGGADSRILCIYVILCTLI